MTNRRRSILALLLAVGITGCDQGTKFHALASLTDTFATAASFGERLELFLTNKHPASTRIVQLIPGFWEHRYLENPGSAFGLWSGASSDFGRTALLLTRAVMALFLLFFLWKTKRSVTASGVALVLGGAVGNLLDGLRFGYVIDFVHWHWYDAFSWPVFNLADVAIAVGMFLLLFDSFRTSRVRAV